MIYDGSRLLFESFERILKDQRTENFNLNSNITNAGVNCASVSPIKPFVHGKKIFQQLRKV